MDLERDFPPKYLAEMSAADGEDYVALLEVCDYHAPEDRHAYLTASPADAFARSD